MPLTKHKRVRLTKKRLSALDYQLSIDDVLYEKFRRLHEELERRSNEWARMRVEVEALTKTEGVTESLRIVRLQRAPNFIRVTVAK